ncbi:MAG TPA: PIN-like domain-containing protein [Acidimicrobiales bacterium]|nr:PIN-like domain-containing protein [Acidimicrobiales bacterium]
MGSLLGGFEGFYRPPAAERAIAYKSGLLALDTSALLEPYRLSPTARSEFLQLLAAMRARLFVPHQVAVEFHRRRIGSVADRTEEFESQRDQLKDLRDKAHGIVMQISRRAHGRDDQVKDVDSRISNAFDEALEFLRGVSEEYDLDPDEMASRPPDPILAQLNLLVEGRVARPPPDAVLVADREEARRRIEAKQPPGFRDRSKDDGGGGDYLWWAEVVRYAAMHRPAHVVLVSNDVAKGDWTYECRGFRVGPAPTLVAEMLQAGGSKLHWSTTSELLAEAPAAMGLAVVSRETLEQARPAISEVVEVIRAAVRASPKPIVSSAVANAALRVDPGLKDDSWSGTGSFRSFLGRYVPEFSYLPRPMPGYVFDPGLHSPTDVRLRSSVRRTLGPDPELERLVAEEEALERAARLGAEIDGMEEENPSETTPETE